MPSHKFTVYSLVFTFCSLLMLRDLELLKIPLLLTACKFERIRTSSCNFSSRSMGSTFDAGSHPERVIGCTGSPGGSHDTIWISLNTRKELHRCPECGSGEFPLRSECFMRIRAIGQLSIPSCSRDKHLLYCCKLQSTG